LQYFHTENKFISIIWHSLVGKNVLFTNDCNQIMW
jgi:hypothetical protein